MNLLIKSLAIVGVLAFGGYGTYRAVDIYGFKNDNERIVLASKPTENASLTSIEPSTPSDPGSTTEDPNSVESGASDSAEGSSTDATGQSGSESLAVIPDQEAA